LAFTAVQVFDGHGNDHGVIAGQNQIDENDAHHCHQEFPSKRNLSQPPQVDHVASFGVFAGAKKDLYSRHDGHAVSKGLASPTDIAWSRSRAGSPP